MLTSEQIINQAYRHCRVIAHNHYENFPVASYLLNRRLRRAISSVYAFARTADDFADEGNISPQARLELLDDYINELEQIEHSLQHYLASGETRFFHKSSNSIFIALADVIYHFQIPIVLFYDLVKAFKQDVSTNRYQSFDELLAYCRLSANPVGRILLYLNKSATAKNLDNSDAICTGLQLINFYQDIAQDIAQNNRLYLPLDEMAHHGVSVDDIRNNINSRQTQALVTLQLHRCKLIYDSGKPLCENLTGRFAIEIRMIFAGGKLVLEKLEKNIASIYQRPRINHRDKFKILWQGVFSLY